MKKFIIIVAVFAALAVLVLVWSRVGKTVPTDADTPNSPTSANADTPDSPAEPNTHLHPSSDSNSANAEAQPAELAARIAARDERMRLSNEAGNPPVTFYGLVVDQDSNALQNVSVALAVIEEYVDPYPQVKTKMTSLQRQTGADGRFEVTGSGLKGKYVTVSMLTKEGYEQEIPGRFETFGTQSTSFDKPGVLKMWSTNLHEPLVTGEKSLVVIPDGRRYSIDLVKGTIVEGEAGDLVAWIKRPENAVRRDKYAWSCELVVPNGGLLESESQAMFTAPDAGYTNAFAYQEGAGISGWGSSTAEKRFYVKSRNGQMYGRIVVKLYAEYNKQPALIRLSYAVNPSGSRLLR